MAYKLFRAWKNTNKSLDLTPYNRATVGSELSQIESDEKLSRELFDQINMRDPIEKQPAFFSDRGINAAQSSLRFFKYGYWTIIDTKNIFSIVIASILCVFLTLYFTHLLQIIFFETFLAESNNLDNVVCEKKI